MRIHILEHVTFEGPGYVGLWAQHHGHSLSKTALHAGEALPGLSDFDCLVIMGGPMSVYDAADHPWLQQEKPFIRECLAGRKKMIGICLGAQLIAEALGARVFKNPYREIGWHALSRTSGLEQRLAGLFPETFPAFHWHGDTFDLPAGAVHLARSAACFNQSFFFPPATLAFQFHLESTYEGIAALIEHCGHEITASPYIQSSAEIHATVAPIAASNAIMQGVLNFIETL